MEDAFPAEPEYPAVADAAEEEAEEEEEEEEEAVAEAPPPALPKKRGRPAGSNNRAPDVYTARPLAHIRILRYPRSVQRAAQYHTAHQRR